MNQEQTTKIKMPRKAKLGIIFVTLGWFWSILFELLVDKRPPLGQIILCLIILYLLIIKKTARKICIWLNVFLIGIGSFIAVTSYLEKIPLLFGAMFVHTILFIIATVFLLNKDSAVYFKKHKESKTV